MIIIAKLFIFNLIGCSGFVLYPPTGVQSLAKQQDNFSSLWAKAAKKKNKRKETSASSRGGFGKVEEKVAPNGKDGDYSVFPALEKQVADTLIPSPRELFEEAGELPGEVYDRLDQIYGFPAFNYETVEESSSDSMSFDELISSTAASGSSSSSNVVAKSTTMPDGDFADLLASATGGSVELPSSTTTKTSHEDSKMDAISSLPPFTKFRVLHVDPLVLVIDDFLTHEECDRYVGMSTAPTNEKGKDDPFQTRSMTVGKDALAKSQRTSTTWFHHYKSMPALMAKASRLVGLDGIDQWEEPQTVRCVSFFFFCVFQSMFIKVAASLTLGLYLLITAIVAMKSLPGIWMRSHLMNPHRIPQVNEQQR